MKKRFFALLLVLLLPVVGFMLYFLFSSRKLTAAQRKSLSKLQGLHYEKESDLALATLATQDVAAHNQAKMLCRMADTALFKNTGTTYFPSGEAMMDALLRDLAAAERFIYLEYFCSDGIYKGDYFYSSVGWHIQI